jgi:integrase
MHSPRAGKSRAAARSSKPRVPGLIYNRSNGRVYALVRWHGRSFALGRADDPEHERRYRAFVGHLLAHGVPPTAAGGAAPPAPSYPVAELVAHYLAHCETYYRHVTDGTATASIDRVRAAVRPLLQLFGATQAREFDVAMLRTYRDHVVALGLSRVTVNGKVQVIRQLFCWAGEEGRLAPEVGLRLRVLKNLRRGRSPAPDLAPRTPVAWEHVEPVLDNMPRPVAGICRVLWHSGARCGEICQLRGRELDMTGPVWTFQPPRHKTQHHGKERFVDMGASAQQVLRPFVRLDPNEYWFSPADAAAEFQAQRRAARKTPLFPSHLRQQAKKRKASPKRRPRACYDSNAIAHAIRKAIAATNRQLAQQHAASGAAGDAPQIPAWTAHQLRHAFLTHTRKALGLETAQAVGGHGSLPMTEHYTATATRELARVAAAKIG